MSDWNAPPRELIPTLPPLDPLAAPPRDAPTFTESPESPDSARKMILAMSDDPTRDDAKLQLSAYFGEKLNLAPSFVFNNFDAVMKQAYGKPEHPVSALQRVWNTIRSEPINHDINKLWSRAAAGFDSPELRTQIEEKKKELPPPEEQIKGFMNPVIQGLISLGYELPKAAYTGMATKEDTAVRKAISVIASVIAPAAIAYVYGPRVVGEIESQAIGASFGASIEAGMDPTVARIQAGVVGVITGALNSIQFGAAATAAQRLGTTVLLKNALSGSLVRIGLAAGEQGAIAYGMTLADKMVNEAAVEASNRLTGTNLPHKEFTRILAEAGIEAIPQALIGTMIAGAGIAGATYRVAKGSRLDAEIRAAVEKVTDQGGAVLAHADTPEMTIEQKRAIYDARVADALTRVKAIEERLKVATPEEKSVLEADLADYQRIASTAFDVNLQWFAQNPGDQNIGDVLRGQESDSMPTMDVQRLADESFATGNIPEGWWVHGRVGKQDLNTGHVIEMTRDWDTAESYAGKNGSKWMLRPRDEKIVFDATRETNRLKVANRFFRDFKNGTLSPSNEDLARSLLQDNGNDIGTARSAFADSLNPEHIADSPGAWDIEHSDFHNWFYEATGKEFIKTQDGAVALTPGVVEAVRVGGGTSSDQRVAEGVRTVKKQVSERTMARIDRETQSVGDQTPLDREAVVTQDRIRALEGRIAEAKDAKKEAVVAALAEEHAKAVARLSQLQTAQSVNKMIRRIAAIDPEGLRDPYRGYVQDVKDAFAEVRHTKKTFAHLNEIKVALEANPDAEISQADLQRLGDLSKTPLRDLSVDDLATVHDAVVMFAKLSRDEHMIKVGVVRMAADKAVADAVTEMPTAKKLAERMISSNQSLGEVKGEVKEWIKDRFGVDLLDFDLLAELLGPTSYKTLFQNVHEGHVVAIKYEQDRIADFAKDTELLDQKHPDMSGWLNERSVAGEGILKDGSTVPLELTWAEQMAMFMHAKNPQNRKHLLEGGFGFKWHKGQKDTVYRITPETLTKIVENVRSNPEAMLYVKAADNLLRRTGQDLDSKFYDLNDVHLEVLFDYYHIEVMPAARGSAADTEMAFDVAKADWARIGLFKGMTKRRINSKLPIYLNPITYDLNRSLDHASAYIGLEEPLRNASRLLYYNRDGKKFRDEVASRVGEQWWLDIEKGLKDIAGMRDNYGVLEDGAMKLRNNIAVATLGINIPSWLKQTLGIINYSAYVEPKYLVLGIFDAIMHPIGVDKMHRAWSPEYVLRARKGFSRETSDVLKGGDYGVAFGQGRGLKARFMAGMQYFDRFAVKRGMQGAVRKVLAEIRDGTLSPEVAKALGITEADIPGLTPAKKMELAYKYADYATERSQNSSMPEFQSTIQRGGAFAKMITLFSSESSQAMNLRRRAYFEAKKTGSARAWGRFAKILIATAVVNTLGSMMIDRARTAARGKKVAPIEKDAAYRLIGATFSGLPIVRDIADPILRHAILGKESTSTSILPIQRIVDTLIGTINSLFDASNAKTATKRNKALLKVADQAAETIGLWKGIPYVPARTLGEVGVNILKKLK